MGIGDAIIATGEVKRLFAKRKLPVYIIAPNGRPQRSDVFLHNPKISAHPPTGHHQRLINGPGHRPYIAAKGLTQWRWKPCRLEPGEFYFTAEERAFAAKYAGMVLIEPTTKVLGSNKAWVADRWQKVVDGAGVPFVQVGPVGTPWLRGVTSVQTTFRQAAAILAVSRAYVGPEGAHHHAAAAVSTPAVVLWSHFVAPNITGYKSQINLRHAGEPCGRRVPCAECRASMERITVNEVLDALSNALADAVQSRHAQEATASVEHAWLRTGYRDVLPSPLSTE